jgi:hypothetical protein
MASKQPKTTTWFYVFSTTKDAAGTIVPQHYWHRFIQIESIRDRIRQIADDPIFQALANGQCLKILVPCYGDGGDLTPTPVSIQSFIDGIVKHTPGIELENPSDNDLLVYRMMSVPTID